MRYLTDGTHLYEVAAMRSVQNYGLTQGMIRYVILRDCITEATATVDELHLAALSAVPVSGSATASGSEPASFRPR
jgi:hypothetical protein